MGQGGAGTRCLSAGARALARRCPRAGNGRRGLAIAAGEAQRCAERPAIRCFVALQPDEAARDRLDRLAEAQQSLFPRARRMRRENLHLTLAFIGALDSEAARRVVARLAAEPIEPFDWTLDAVGTFGGARVLWAGGSDARLQALAQRARRLLDELGIGYDRKPFVAHVTLLRNVPRAAATAAALAIEPPILWHAVAPVLLQSTTSADGTRYTPVAAGGEC
jgi:2'-5' RNA ligase